MFAKATTVLSGLTLGVSAVLTHDVGFQLSIHPRSDMDLARYVAGLSVAALYHGDGDQIIIATDAQITTFFVNETTADPSTWTTNWAAPEKHSYGLSLREADGSGMVMAHLREGPTGQPGIRVSDNGPAELLGPYDWMYCDEAVEFYRDQHFNVLKARTDPTVPVPGNCVQVQLKSYCAPIPREAGADLSHAARVRCDS